MGVKINFTGFGHYTDYFDGKKLNGLTEQAAKLLEATDFDTIAVCGISGLLLGAPLASSMGKQLMVVKKPNEPTRSMEEMAQMGWGDSALDKARDAFSVLGYGENQKILLLDDHISTGTTIKLMISSIYRQCTNPYFSGAFLYYVPGWYRLLEGTPKAYVMTVSEGVQLRIPVVCI